MKRKCHFCEKWHMDFNCPSRPSSYSVSTTYDEQWHSSSDDADASDVGESSTPHSVSSGSDDHNVDGRRWRNPERLPTTYHNVYSNNANAEKPSLKLPKAAQYRIEELPIAFSVGTGVSYLSAQPCPVKAWVGVPPSASRVLTDGVADSGGPSIIDRRLVPRSYTILESPMKPVFSTIGNGQTLTSGYVVLPVHFPNAAALSGDERSGTVVKL
jgi:hypothetical protein